MKELSVAIVGVYNDEEETVMVRWMVMRNEEEAEVVRDWIYL